MCLSFIQTPRQVWAQTALQWDTCLTSFGCWCHYCYWDDQKTTMVSFSDGKNHISQSIESKFCSVNLYKYIYNYIYNHINIYIYPSMYIYWIDSESSCLSNLLFGIGGYDPHIPRSHPELLGHGRAMAKRLGGLGGIYSGRWAGERRLELGRVYLIITLNLSQKKNCYTISLTMHSN